MARILLDAICGGNVSLAKDIITDVSYRCIDSQTSRRDGTALFFCCSRGYLELAVLLINKNANVNARNKCLATPLHAAADNNHFKMFNINAQNHRGDTPLHLAAFRGHADVAQCLVESGADFLLANDSNVTPVMDAIGRGHVEVGQYLNAFQHLYGRPSSSSSSSSSSTAGITTSTNRMVILDPPPEPSAPSHSPPPFRSMSPSPLPFRPVSPPTYPDPTSSASRQAESAIYSRVMGPTSALHRRHSHSLLLPVASISRQCPSNPDRPNRPHSVLLEPNKGSVYDENILHKNIPHQITQTLSITCPMDTTTGLRDTNHHHHQQQQQQQQHSYLLKYPHESQNYVRCPGQQSHLYTRIHSHYPNHYFHHHQDHPSLPYNHHPFQQQQQHHNTQTLTTSYELNNPYSQGPYARPKEPEESTDYSMVPSPQLATAFPSSNPSRKSNSLIMPGTTRTILPKEHSLHPHIDKPNDAIDVDIKSRLDVHPSALSNGSDGSSYLGDARRDDFDFFPSIPDPLHHGDSHHSNNNMDGSNEYITPPLPQATKNGRGLIYNRLPSTPSSIGSIDSAELFESFRTNQDSVFNQRTVSPMNVEPNSSLPEESVGKSRSVETSIEDVSRLNSSDRNQLSRSESRQMSPLKSDDKDSCCYSIVRDHGGSNATLIKTPAIGNRVDCSDGPCLSLNDLSSSVVPSKPPSPSVMYRLNIPIGNVYHS